MGKRLLYVFGIARDISWDKDIQNKNTENLLKAEKEVFGIGSEIRRAFVYHFCILLDSQKNRKRELSYDETMNFIQNSKIPVVEEKEE